MNTGPRPAYPGFPGAPAATAGPAGAPRPGFPGAFAPAPGAPGGYPGMPGSMAPGMAAGPAPGSMAPAPRPGFPGAFAAAPGGGFPGGSPVPGPAGGYGGAPGAPAAPAYGMAPGGGYPPAAGGMPAPVSSPPPAAGGWKAPVPGGPAPMAAAGGVGGPRPGFPGAPVPSGGMPPGAAPYGSPPPSVGAPQAASSGGFPGGPAPGAFPGAPGGGAFPGAQGGGAFPGGPRPGFPGAGAAPGGVGMAPFPGSGSGMPVAAAGGPPRPMGGMGGPPVGMGGPPPVSSPPPTGPAPVAAGGMPPPVTSPFGMSAGGGGGARPGSVTAPFGMGAGAAPGAPGPAAGGPFPGAPPAGMGGAPGGPAMGPPPPVMGGPGPAAGMGMGGPGMGGGMPGMGGPTQPSMGGPAGYPPSVGGIGGVAGGMPAGPTPAPVPLAVVDEAHQCSSAFMSFTMGAVPATSTLATQAALPFGVTVCPLSEAEGKIESRIPVVDFGPAGVIRCKKCRAYVNPFVKFTDGGKRWRCNFCAYLNDVPAEYFHPTDPEGNRLDAPHRPELSQGSVEFIAPAEYTVRPPQPPCFVFVIDVSWAAITNGILATTVATIKANLDSLPGGVRTQVGFITFDSTVHFYSLKAGLKVPQTLVVADVDDLFMPVPEELLVNLHDSRPLVDALLDALPSMFAHNRAAEVALGPALTAGYNMMQNVGGKLLLFLTTLPTIGPGKLRPREAPKMLGSDKEHLLLAPDTGDDGSFYKNKAVDFSRQQISVDAFFFAHQYIDVASIGALPRYTAGQCYYYPGYTAALDSERFAKDLARDLTRFTGWEAVMRVRTSKGLLASNFYGNFFIRGTDLLALPNVTPDTAFNVELTHEEPLAPGTAITIQAALLYTTSSGERRICVHTLCKPVATNVVDLFKGVDVDTLCNMMAKVALDHALRLGVPMARRYLHRACVDIIRAYRNAGGGPGGGMVGPAGLLARAPPGALGAGPGAGAASGDLSTMLPECLRLLPLYAMALQKCTLFRGGDGIRSDERATLVYRMLTMSVAATRSYAYPRLFSLHDLDDAAGRPDPREAAAAAAMYAGHGPAAVEAAVRAVPVRLPAGVNLTAERLCQDGVFLLDSGGEQYLWIGRAAPPPLLEALFGVQSFDAQPGGTAGYDPAAHPFTELNNDYSARVHAILRSLAAAVPGGCARLRIARDGSGSYDEARFYWHLVEDRQNFPGGTVTYGEYLPIVHRESQMQQLGGTAPPPGPLG